MRSIFRHWQRSCIFEVSTHVQISVCIVSLENVATLSHLRLAPTAISSLDEGEHTQRVYVVAQRDSTSRHHGLRGLDMGPGSLVGEEIGEEKLAAEVVDCGDQSSFLLGQRRP